MLQSQSCMVTVTMGAAAAAVGLERSRTEGVHSDGAWPDSVEAMASPLSRADVLDSLETLVTLVAMATRRSGVEDRRGNSTELEGRGGDDDEDDDTNDRAEGGDVGDAGDRAPGAAAKDT
eukprot:m.242194 g.242194  ORF g.242194 m.242194 type:complete len:120 (+) comp19006_c3_seq1:141-500(+)